MCPDAAGATAQELLEIFDSSTGELFSDNQGVLLTSRVRGLAKIWAKLHGRSLPLVNGHRWALVSWNRAPRAPLAREAWRRRVEAAELFAFPATRLRQTMWKWACTWRPG